MDWRTFLFHYNRSELPEIIERNLNKMLYEVKFLTIFLGALYIIIEYGSFLGNKGVGVTTRFQVACYNGAVHTATKQNAYAGVLLVEFVHLCLYLGIYFLSCFDGNPVCQRMWFYITMTHTFSKIHSVLPDIAEGDIRTQAEIFVYHKTCN